MTDFDIDEDELNILTEPAEQIAAITTFFDRIGLPVRRATLEQETFLPGVTIRDGALTFDPDKLLDPGDLLHEAGHMAVMTPEERNSCTGDAGPDGGAEVAALAWSYAAAVEIGLAARVVFHPHGYKSGGDSIAANFEEGRYIGVPMLQWFGLTKEARQGAKETGPDIYPRMTRWLRT